MKSVSLKTYLN